MSFLFIFFLFLFNNAHAKLNISLQCKDENNNVVDWYVLYKVPKISESNIPSIRKGLAYIYITSASINLGWQLSEKNIDSETSIPGYTLAPLYNEESDNLMWLLYNDDPPNEPLNGKYGHTKGAVMVKDRGFWLIHSVPNFPPAPNNGNTRRNHTTVKLTDFKQDIGTYSYPESGRTYGQSFLCISLDSDQFDTIGRQLMYNQIIVYANNLPPILSHRYPVLKNATEQIRIRKPPFNNKVVIKSLASLEFISFAKSDKWQKDLYDDFVAPQLQSDIYVETWLNGRGRLPSECNGSKVYNVESVILKTANVAFKSSRDHSKWAVTANNKNNRNWVCVGDINRADTQYNRGGGTVCFNLNSVWRNYRESVNDIEPCPKRNFIQTIRDWFG